MRTSSWRVSAPSSLCLLRLVLTVQRFLRSKPKITFYSDKQFKLNVYEISLHDFSVYRPRDPAFSGRIQVRALSCWTCGESTSTPTVPAVGGFHPHPSSALPRHQLGLNTLPGFLEIPIAAPVVEYQRCLLSYCI